jgi:hypothetical protein
MYQGKGNTAAAPRRKAPPAPETQALYIAESIRTRQAEGRGYALADYGLEEKPEMIEHVARALGVIL